jgi:hypothetical protein
MDTWDKECNFFGYGRAHLMSALLGVQFMPNEIQAEPVLEKHINAALSAEAPFVDVSSATELLFHLERAASALKRSLSRALERAPNYH